jgi:hypothetical protein
VSQRSKFFAGNLLNHQSVAIALASQARYRHSSHRKCDLHGISKAKRGMRRNFRLQSIHHRRALRTLISVVVRSLPSQWLIPK